MAFAYALTTVGFWGLWSLLGKLALRDSSPLQATLLFGLFTASVAAAGLLAGGARGSWGGRTIAIAVASAACGAVGTMTFYLALQRGNASVVVPMMASYPALVVIGSRLLGEAPTRVQLLGVGLSLLGAALLSQG